MNLNMKKSTKKQN